MNINVYELDCTEWRKPLASFTTATEFNQWLKSPKLPRYYKAPEWCYGDLTGVLRDGGHMVLGGCLYPIGSGLMDWASFHLEVVK